MVYTPKPPYPPRPPDYEPDYDRVVKIARYVSAGVTKPDDLDPDSEWDWEVALMQHVPSGMIEDIPG